MCKGYYITFIVIVLNVSQNLWYKVVGRGSGVNIITETMGTCTTEEKRKAKIKTRESGLI